jgi:threonine dehydratase
MPSSAASSADEAISLQTVTAAVALIRDQIGPTPCVHSQALSELTGVHIFLKLENLQYTGSFKERGAIVKLASLAAAERAQGVIAMSAGNHAQAVAYHARRLGIPAVIVMPRFTPNIKVERTGAFGAEVVLHGESLSEAGERAHVIAADRGLAFIHPYDDPAIISGQGTIVLELLREAEGLDAIIVPIGGGGLIAGIAMAAKSLHPEIEIFGVEAARYPSMLRALEGGEPEFGAYTIAEGIAVKEPGRYTLPIVRQLVDRILLADEADIEEAVLLLLEGEKTVAEGAGAAPLAAVRRNLALFAGRRVGLIISGGNIDLPVLSSIIQRGLVRSCRLARLTVTIHDVPGELAKAAGLVGAMGANIVQVLHQRIFAELPLQATELQFVLQTRGPAHLAQITAALRAAGHAVRVDRAGAEDEAGE